MAALAATSLAIATPTSTSAAQAPIYIDAGGSGGTDPYGNVWLSDRYYVGGTTGSITRPIADTDNQKVFQSWRTKMSAYRIPVTNGTYWVKLLVSEPWWTGNGKRVFDVVAEGAQAFDNVDVHQRAPGRDRADYLVFKKTVADGVLDLTFPTSVDQSLVDGIVVEPSTGSTPTPTPTPTPTSTSGSGSVMWGMDDGPYFDSTEAGLGRKFALVREYRRLDQTFLDTRMKNLANNGRSLVLSVTARNATNYIKYADITAGRYDSAFINGWSSLQSLATPTYFIFQHEADSTDAKASCTTSTADTTCGPQFIAAWKHLYNLAKSRGYSKVIFMWTVTNYGFHPQTNQRAKHYWPGNSYTDWVGIDAYSGGCNSDWWGDLEDIMANSINWLKVNAPTKSIIMPEWGAIEWGAGDKPNFFNNTPSTLTKPGYNKIRGLVYWNQKPETHCDYRINSTTASYNAFKSLGLKSMMSAPAGLR